MAERKKVELSKNDLVSWLHHPVTKALVSALQDISSNTGKDLEAIQYKLCHGMIDDQKVINHMVAVYGRNEVINRILDSAQESQEFSLLTDYIDWKEDDHA